ncbi:MAG: signal peptidase I [Clostridiaceae bacterium]|nr:signal peptidase I [Clostridiaceae bacterium]
MRKAILLEKQIQSGRGINKRNKARRLFQTGGRILFLIVVLMLVVTIISANTARNKGEVPNILGFNFFVVESGSMEPTINIGAVIVCRKPKEPGKLKVNDIITFKNLAGYIVTHRIIEVITDNNGTTAYRTKGDNPRNSVDPELLTPDRILSVFVVKIPLT